GAEVPVSWREIPYTDGDPIVGKATTQHGTGVAALMGARNGVIIPGSTTGDRGINGLLHNPMPYKILIRRVSPAGSVTNMLAALTDAVLSRAKVLNASDCQVWPINERTNSHSRLVTGNLKRLSDAFAVVAARLLFVASAGNCAVKTPMMPDADGVRGRIVPYDPNGGADKNGNSVAGSLGLAPNVFAVGA